MTVQNIPVAQIVPPRVSLRPVRTDSIEFLELLESIKDVGLMSSICVRPLEENKFEVIEGAWRLTAAKMAHLETVPAIVKEGLSDCEVLIMQVSANAIRPETKPCEFAAQLWRISKEVDEMTVPRLASMVNKSVHWVREQLRLLDLSKKIRAAIDRGEIKLNNAYKLARVPIRLREGLIEHAKVLSTKEFTRLVGRVQKQFHESVRQGRMREFYCEEFQPVAHLRALKEIEAEYENGTCASAFLETPEYQTRLDAWKAALQWVLHLDPASLEQQEREHLKRDRKKKQELENDYEQRTNESQSGPTTDNANR